MSIFKFIKSFYLKLISPQKKAKWYKKHRVFHHQGENCYIDINISEDEGYLISLGNNVWITDRVVLLAHDASVVMLRNSGIEIPWLDKVGKIDIKDNVFIGNNAIILPNITIGPNAIIGAGSIVTKNVPPNTVVGGNPAKLICSLDEYIKKTDENTTQYPWNANTPHNQLISSRNKYFWKKYGD